MLTFCSGPHMLNVEENAIEMAIYYLRFSNNYYFIGIISSKNAESRFAEVLQLPYRACDGSVSKRSGRATGNPTTLGLNEFRMRNVANQTDGGVCRYSVLDADFRRLWICLI